MKPTPEIAKGFDNVYDPAEDSFFLLDCLEKDEQFLQTFIEKLPGVPFIAELGTGTGVVSSFVPQVTKSEYLAYATDVNPAACACARETWSLNWQRRGSGLEVVRGNLLDFFRPQLVDVLLFNPPYVPSETVPERPNNESDQEDIKDDRWVDLALDGGDDGMEVTNIVLENLDRYLSPTGVAYILFCASNKPEQVCKRMSSAGWVPDHIDTRRAGWEILSVYRFSKAA